MDTIQTVFEHLENQPPNPKALNFVDRRGQWQSISTKEMLHQARCIGAALKVMGLKPGDKVAIMSLPSPFWAICDLGIMYAGYVTVPIFHNISEDNFILEVTQSEAKAIFVSGPGCHQLCEKYIDYFERIISIDQNTFFKEELLYKDLISLGETALKEDLNFPPTILANDTATIIYTSGTTAIPKGVELSHDNLFCQIDNTKERLGLHPYRDRFLLVLPMAHILGRLAYLTTIKLSISLYFSNDMAQLPQTFQDVKPTIFAVVPRLIEKLYNGIQQEINNKGFIGKKLGNWALNLANKNQEELSTRLLYPLAYLILYSKIQRYFGGELRLMASGSAKGNIKLMSFFKNIGIPILEGYGLTEACPAFCNSITDIRLGTIGKVMPGVEARISESGELLLRGNTVMKGYYRNPVATAAVLNLDGWLSTSDYGEIDEKGYLHLKGRLSDKCKTSYGEFVDRPTIEQLTNQLPFVDVSVVIAENRPFVTCLFFPNIEELERLKKQMELKDLSYEELLRMEFIKKEMERSLQMINEHLNQWEKIRGYRFLYHKATIETGELSPSLKVRHGYIEKKYAPIINELYPESTL